MFFKKIKKDPVMNCYTLMQEIEMSLSKKDIDTYYQLIVDDNGEIMAIELLNRPSQTSMFTSPDQFYSFAASHGQIHKVDTKVIDIGISRLMGSKMGAAYVFLNVHLSTLFTLDWEEILPNLHVGEATIVLELSEREGLSGYSKVEVVRKMKELRAKGMKIAVDDIGKGYSGLHTLAMVEPDFVKIDRDLVKDIEADSYRQHMMRALIQYWKQQNVDIIAEGIETESEWSFFKTLGVRYYQGYYFHKPNLVKHVEVIS